MKSAINKKEYMKIKFERVGEELDKQGIDCVLMGLIRESELFDFYYPFTNRLGFPIRDMVIMLRAFLLQAPDDIKKQYADVFRVLSNELLKGTENNNDK